MLMRNPCRVCGWTEGKRDDRNGQACIFCVSCGSFAYNAPKSETGESQRSLRTRPDIKPSQRARILERDGNRCHSCGKDSSQVILNIGHVLSVDDGRIIGATDEELFDDENLFTVCEECNSGQGARSLPPRFALRLIRARRSA